ncbi:unnamed protein product (macronuclear) [Paramecium tetraurelia]|uniref:Uncharacterized protein n=1 Tax=Paramecium tetraurelia TaxID=5888 RepID=A0BGY5_PARTE|nr:uncharacterized protein GSPATT00028837001 [Paramecium tetraurelia]CAK57802.1 unnamed protein product [Paramecium tetraurelia]|eukprot:XP_001425200.1 hypothetical protein (macronuclear) [Paramecium tetraurelia strain d4-2]
MFIQASIPRTRFAITPTNVRYVCLDSTPNRQKLDMTQRIDDKLPIRQPNDRPQILVNQHKENLTRIPGNSFSLSSSSKELQIQIQELTKQRDSMQYTLQEAIRKSNLMEQQLDVLDSILYQQLQSQKIEQAIQFQVNMDQFQDQINILTKKLQDLINDNNYLQEQYQSQQFYIEELGFQENDQFNITHNFGQM